MRWTSSLLGFALLTLAVGLKPREVGKASGFLARLLSRVDDAVRARAAQRGELLREFSVFSTQVIRWVVGERLLSLRAAWTSAAISLASFLFWAVALLGAGALRDASRGSSTEWLPAAISGLPLAIVIVTTVGLLPKIHRHAAKLLWFVFVIWLLNAVSVVVDMQAYGQGIAVGLGLAWSCSSAGNLLATWVLRRRLGVSATQSSTTEGTFVAVTILLAIGVALAPMAVAIVGVGVTPLGTWMRHSVPQFAAMRLVLTCVVGASNAVTACLAVACAVILVLAEFQRGAVAMVGRFLSPPVGQRLLRMRKVIFWVGLLLLLGPVVAGIVVK